METKNTLEKKLPWQNICCRAQHLPNKRAMQKKLLLVRCYMDIGHFTSEFGTYHPDDTEDRHHEEAGAEILDKFFPSVITDCVRFHVAAKRYLCATNQSYFAKLSKASVHTLELQGGPMNSTEVADFSKNPNLEEIIAVRYLDDAGKVNGFQTPEFAHFAPMVQRMVDRHCAMIG